MRRWAWRQYARLLARLGRARGFFWLGLLAESSGDDHHAIEQANLHYKRAARAGHVDAMWHLAANRLAEKGGRRDPEEAVYWLHKAADGNHPMALWALAGLYLKGGGLVEADVQRGVELLQRSAQSGFGPACLKLAECYHQGRHGLPRDRGMAAQWVARATSASARR